MIHPTACPLDCPDTCGALAEVDEDGRLLRLRGNPDHSWSRGALCGKTAIAHEFVNAPNRLAWPLVRESGSLRRATWDEALDRIARGMDGLSGEELLALSYAGNMGLVARGFPMRMMHALGASTTDGGICDSTANAGYEAIMGHVIGPDIETASEADLMVIWGCDARRTTQHLMPRAREVLRRGGTVIVLDIYETDTMRQVRGWGGEGIVLRPGSDTALALALIGLCFERGSADEEYLARECVGVDELRGGTMGVAQAAQISGLSSERIEALYQALVTAREPFLKVGVGWTRRRYGGTSMRAVCALAAVLGQADRLHFESSDHFGLDVDGIRQPWRVPEGTAPPVIRHVELGRELESGRFRAAFVWGHNPVVTVPDAGRVRAGLERDDLMLVVHELFLTETAALADVVLPAAAWVETSDVYKSYGHRVLHYARRASRCGPEQRSNVTAFGALAERIGLEKELWDTTEEDLCEDFLEANTSRFRAEELETLLAGEPVKLAPRTLEDRGTPSGKIELVSARAEAAGEPGLPVHREDEGTTRGEFWFLAAPSIATHNSTYGHVSRHRKRAGAPRVWMAPQDARRLGIKEQAVVRLVNEQGELKLPAAFDGAMPAGMVRVDGLPQAGDVGAAVGLNLLAGPGVSDLGDGNVLYSNRVDVRV